MLRNHRFGTMMKSSISWQSSLTVVHTRCAGALYCWNWSWFSAFNFIKNMKYACNSKFTDVYVCQKLSKWRLVWRSYCQNKMVQFFWLTWYFCDNGIISKFNLISEHFCNTNIITKTIQRMQWCEEATTVKTVFCDMPQTVLWLTKLASSIISLVDERVKRLHHTISLASATAHVS